MEIFPHTENGSEESLSHEKTQRILSATSKVKSKSGGRGGFRAGAGRKPKSFGGGMEGPTGGTETQAEDAPSQADLEFVYETAKAGLACVDGLVTKRVEKAVLSIDQSFAPKALEFADQVRVAPDEIELVGKTFKALAAKYSILSRYAPEMMLVGWGTTYAMRVSNTLSEIKKLSVAIKAMKGPGNANSSQADKNPDSGKVGIG